MKARYTRSIRLRSIPRPLDRAESEARRMKAKQASNKPETLCWRARFLFSLVASLMLVYTFAVVAPLEIVASSVNSLLSR